MKIDREEQQGVTILRLQGELVQGTEAGLVKTVVGLLEAEGARIVLDLHGVSFLSSAGLGALVRVTAQANAQRGRIVLARPSAFVSGALETTMLNRFFEVYPDEAAAIAAVQRPRTTG